MLQESCPRVIRMLSGCYKNHHGCDDKLAEYGISDLYSDMLDRNNIRSVYNLAMTYVVYDYLVDYYDPHIGISCVDKCGEYSFIRFLRPHIPTGSKGLTINTAAAEVSCPEDDYSIRTVYDVICSLPEGEGGFGDYAINMIDTYTGDIYSYAMESDGNSVYGSVWCMNDTWSPSVTRATLNGIDSEGNVTELGDITAGFEGILGGE